MVPPVFNLKSERTKNTAAIFFITAAVLTLNCLGVFSWVFFRDFAIVFDGGYRVLIGQVPYRDFFIPVGPVVFYLQAFFDLLFGVNLWASALHAGVLAAVLADVYYLVTVKRFGFVLSVVMAVAMFFSYTGFINYPWYNQTAYFFFLLNALLLFPQLDRATLKTKYLIASGFLTVLGFFSKQDVGLLHFGLMTGCLFFWKGGFRRVLFCYFFPVLILTGLAVWGWQSVGDFLSCFGFGQSQHLSRLSNLLTPNIMSSWQFYGLFLCALFLVNRHVPGTAKRRFLLLGMLILVPLITQCTSGVIEQTRLEGIPVVLYLAYDLLRMAFKDDVFGRGRWVVRIAVLAAALITLNPFFLIGRYLTGTILTDSRFDESKRVYRFRYYYSYIDYIRIPDGSYKGCFIKSKVYEDLAKTKQIIREHGGNFFNFSEYGFLHADFKSKPLTGFPLWFHHGVSFFDGDVPVIRRRLLDAKPPVILFQLAYTHQMIKYVFLTSFLQEGYKYVFSAESPMVVEGIEVLAREDNPSV